MERLARRRQSGMGTDGLRIWGIFFVMLGVIGRGVFQNRLLNTGEPLIEVLAKSDLNMIFATLALVLQAAEGVALPIYAMLVVEGFQHTSNFGKYFLRVTALAVVCEIPYNFAVGAAVLDTSTRNPVFAVVICLVMLYFYKRYESRSFVNVMIKLLVTAAAFLWTSMLRIELAPCLVVLVAVLWLFRNKTNYRTLAGCSAAVLCTVIPPLNPAYLTAPMGFMLLHFYNGEKGEQSTAVRYLTYPVLLVIAGVIGHFVCAA